VVFDDMICKLIREKRGDLVVSQKGESGAMLQIPDFLDV
jgi:hypothetical protein